MLFRQHFPELVHFFWSFLLGLYCKGIQCKQFNIFCPFQNVGCFINGENMRKQGEINREIRWLPIKYKQINVLKYKQEYISREWLTETNKTEKVAMKVPLCYLCALAMWLIQEVKKNS